MCGIAGIVHTERHRSVDPVQLARMAGEMAHRGPDGHGLWHDGGAGLAHRRLAIIDLQGGRQPFVSAESGSVLVFNGEIYNYRELRADLIAHGAIFREQSDTEVVLRAFEVWGDACVSRLRGMFAFAIWDPRRQRLFAARDRLGIKPFYYRWDDATLTFASELKPILAVADAPPVLDEASLDAYLRLQYVPGPSTIVSGVRQLPPASTLTLEATSPPREQKYWRLPRETERKTPASTDDFRDRMREAVSTHLVADVPVGAFLSGGLDSSLIVAQMVQLASGPVHTFSVGFAGGPRFDEREAARHAASVLGTVHHECEVTETAALDELPALVARMDEPLADYATLPTFFIARLAAASVKVVLTGEGADELFGGYRRYRRERLFGALARLGGAYQPSHLFSDREVARLRGRRPAALTLATTPRANGDDALNRLLSQDIETWLPDDLLTKVDRMTMLCSLEARVPYLDHVFVEYAMRIRGEDKIDPLRGGNKLLMRRAGNAMLPESITSRPKHGFTAPVDAWLRGGLHGFARETLLAASARVGARIDPRETRRLLDELAAGRPRGHQIWGLLVYELWSQRHGVT